MQNQYNPGQPDFNGGYRPETQYSPDQGWNQPHATGFNPHNFDPNSKPQNAAYQPAAGTGAAPTKLEVVMHESNGADVSKTYVRMKYAGQSNRTATEKTKGQTAVYQQPWSYTLDAEVVELKLMEDKFGADAELAQGALLVDTTRPNEWTGWVRLESLNKKATAPSVRLSYVVK